MLRCVDDLGADFLKNRRCAFECRDPPAEIRLHRVVGHRPEIPAVPMDAVGIRHVEAEQDDPADAPLQSEIERLEPTVATRPYGANRVEDQFILVLLGDCSGYFRDFHPENVGIIVKPSTLPGDLEPLELW